MAFILVRVTTTAGKTTLTNTNGTVRSLNPNGPAPTTYNWQDRPVGSNGVFEECSINGGIVAYNPLGVEPVLFRFVQDIPGGFSALDIDRLT